MNCQTSKRVFGGGPRGAWPKLLYQRNIYYVLAPAPVTKGIDGFSDSPLSRRRFSHLRSYYISRGSRGGLRRKPHPTPHPTPHPIVCHCRDVTKTRHSGRLESYSRTRVIDSTCPDYNGFLYSIPSHCVIICIRF